MNQNTDKPEYPLAEWTVSVEEIGAFYKNASNLVETLNESLRGGLFQVSEVPKKLDEIRKTMWLGSVHAEKLAEDMRARISAPDKEGQITWGRLQKIENVLNPVRKTRKRKD